MSHFAELDENNTVLRVIVAEQGYIDTIKGTWVQTSYNAKIRGKYAAIGDLYDVESDVFVTPEVDTVDVPTKSGNMP